MARKSSRRRKPRRRVSRKARRRSVKANRRRRRLRRNQFLPKWSELQAKVIVPVLGATAGFVAARYAGNWLAMRDLGTADPKVAKTIAAAVGIPAVYMVARRYPMVARNSGALVLGMGMASAEAWLRDTPMLGGSPAAAAITDAAPAPEVLTAGPVPIPEADAPGEATVVEDSGAGAYYNYATTPSGKAALASYYDYPTNQYGQAALADHYSGSMLGGLGDVDAISTVTPTGVAMRAKSFPQVRKVSEPFVTQGDRGHAGGMFARTLFSGMIN